MKKVKRSRMGGFIVLGLISLLFSLTCSGKADAAEKSPIKIGFIVVQSGGLAALGLETLEGFKTYFEEVDYKVAGRKIEIINVDAGDKPDIAIPRARKLIDHEKVDIMTGLFATLNAYAVAPLCTAAKLPLVIMAAAATDLTQRKRSNYVARVAPAAVQYGFPLGDYAYKNLGLRKVVTIAHDYGWGWECKGGFQEVFESLGGKVIQQMWPPFDTMDFGPYISNINPEADGIYSVVTGTATVRLIKGLRDTGMLDKMKFVGGGPVTDENYLPALGDAARGGISSMPVSASLDTPEYIAFKTRYVQRNRRPPTGYSSVSYTGAQWIAKAIETLNGDISDKDKFMRAIRAVEIPNSIRGPLKMDKYGQMVNNIYIRKVEKVGDAYQNTVVQIYPMVSQFWTYDPETFMKQPSYSRDYPPCKFCK